MQVARLAGIPAPVIHRAKEILKKLEDADITRKEKRIRRGKQPIQGQIDVFTFNTAQRNCDEVLNELRELDITTLTPLDAINVLYNLQKKVKG
ncbi:DNA mismatch repair protein MutS [Acetivibrio straminisolvens JCM 21531]|uniref:DNA mismatch repair protein MutS n=1 Tax=Acetivibrio straminisolvens JCM 21531 TaxID=1294263 RepID=W4V9U2_9FIRM|nr:DNA mismatch repair protein MutS [Acetivibrio straminisolvens JCM 21531]